MSSGKMSPVVKGGWAIFSLALLALCAIAMVYFLKGDPEADYIAEVHAEIPYAAYGDDAQLLEIGQDICAGMDEHGGAFLIGFGLTFVGRDDATKDAGSVIAIAAIRNLCPEHIDTLKEMR